MGRLSAYLVGLRAVHGDGKYARRSRADAWTMLFADQQFIGGHLGLADLQHFVDKRWPQRDKRIVAYEVVDHPTECELVVISGKHFVQYDLMVGTPVPV